MDWIGIIDLYINRAQFQGSFRSCLTPGFDIFSMALAIRAFAWLLAAVAILFLRYYGERATTG
jgi:hypothetical protein